MYVIDVLTMVQQNIRHFVESFPKSIRVNNRPCQPHPTAAVAPRTAQPRNRLGADVSVMTRPRHTAVGCAPRGNTVRRLLFVVAEFNPVPIAHGGQPARIHKPERVVIRVGACQKLNIQPGLIGRAGVVGLRFAECPQVDVAVNTFGVLAECADDGCLNLCLCRIPCQPRCV